jgi:putative membrane protein
VVVLISALALLWLRGFEDFSDGWLHAKLALVVGLTAAHGLMARWRKDFANGANRHSQRFYRIANEVPTVLMIGIVVLVVVKPF